MATSKSKRSGPAPAAAPAPGAALTSAPAPASPAAPLAFDRYQRWRLILGKRVEEQMSNQRCQGGMGRQGEGTLSREMAEMDGALGAIYDIEETQPDEKGKRGAGLGGSRPKVSTWLGDIRKYFESDVVAVIQQDAIEKKGWRQLLFEPESLAQVTPSVELVGTLMELKGLIPDETKETARQVIRAVVEEIKKRMQAEIERAVRGALDRSRHQPIASLPNMDWKRTIGANLKNYIPSRKTIIPDRFFFYARQQRRREWNVIVCMDQSGSMADSVVYGSVMGSILASLPALETHVVVFDTEVVDLTAQLSDPVDFDLRHPARRRDGHRPGGRLLPGLHPQPAADALHPAHRPLRGRQPILPGAAPRGDGLERGAGDVPPGAQRFWGAELRPYPGEKARRRRSAFLRLHAQRAPADARGRAQGAEPRAGRGQIRYAEEVNRTQPLRRAVPGCSRGIEAAVRPPPRSNWDGSVELRPGRTGARL